MLTTLTLMLGTKIFCERCIISLMTPSPHHYVSSHNQPPPLLFGLTHRLSTCLAVFWKSLHIFNDVEEINLLDNSSISILPLLQTTRSIGGVPPANYIPSLRGLLLLGIDLMGWLSTPWFPLSITGSESWPHLKPIDRGGFAQ